MSMYDNTPADKKYTANTAGEQTADPLDPQSWPQRYQHSIWALQTLDDDIVLTDNETPSSWIKADPADAVTTEAMA